MSDLKCTQYSTYDDDFDEHITPCPCPVCGGFLKWVGEKPICNKCGTELIAIPEKDEETGKEYEQGKICPISKPKNPRFKPREGKGEDK